MYHVTVLKKIIFCPHSVQHSLSISVHATTPNGKFFPVREVLSCSGSCDFAFQKLDSHKSDLELNMDFGILNLIEMDAKLDFNAFTTYF